MLDLPDYSHQLMQQLWTLRIGGHFCDCTVLVGDSPHRAHKLLLAASSMLFRSLLTTSDTISIDTAVVSSQEFSCLLDMIYTGKLPLGKYNVSRIIAAADSLQMFDVAISFKKVLTTIVNPQPSTSENDVPQDGTEKDSTDSNTPPQEIPLKTSDAVRETKSPHEHLPHIKKKKQNKEHSSSDSADKSAAEPHETLEEDAAKEVASSEQPSTTVLRVLEHSSIIIEALKKTPAIKDRLFQASKCSLDQQDRQVVMTCCDTVDPDKVGEMLLSHVKKGVLSATAIISLLTAVHEHNPTASAQLTSALQEMETDAAPNQQKDSTQSECEAEDTEEGGAKGEKSTEEQDDEMMTDDSDDDASKKSLSKKHTCRFCKRTFNYKCRLRAHLKRCFKSEKRPFHQCPKCPETFPTNTALMRHQIQAHKHKVQCELCGRKFAHPSGMLYHMRSEHFEEKPYTCKTCGAKFAAKSSLKNHERLHTGEKPYVCKECDMSFTVAAGLAYHIKKKHSQENMYTCQYCKAEFAQSIELTRHVRTHTGDRPYVCRECGKGYSQASQLTVHLETAHASSETFDCQKCSLSFSSRLEHNNHVQKLHPDEFHKCPACEKVFSSVNLLNKHKTTHKGVKLFSCDLCNKSYQQLSGLWYHNRTQHAEVFSNHTRQIKALVQCDICFKFFPSEKSLAQHQAIEHQGSLSSALRCPLCSALFADATWMQEHIASHHVEQRETVCMHCFVMFSSGPELQEHIVAQHPEAQEAQEIQEAQEEQDAPVVPAEAQGQSVDDAEQVKAAEGLLQPATSHGTDFVLSDSQAHFEQSQQVLVALADGQEGARVVEMSMFDLLNNSVTFICEESAPGTSSQT